MSEPKPKKPPNTEPNKSPTTPDPLGPPPKPFMTPEQERRETGDKDKKMPGVEN